MQNLFTQNQVPATSAESANVELQVFNCDLGNVRVVVKNDTPFFMASDLCNVLEYKNGRDTINRMFGDSVAKYYAGVETGKKADGSAIVQNKLCSFITESQMYKLIMRSKAKNAEKLQDWVTNEVLPAIRKSGAYSVAPQIDLSNPLNVLEALRDSVEKQIVLYKENEALKLENENQKVKLGSYKEIEKQKRSKEVMAMQLNKHIRELAETRFSKDYKKAYRYIYEIFASKHLISEKITMAYLRKNNDYLAECLEIVLSELD